MPDDPTVDELHEEIRHLRDQLHTSDGHPPETDQDEDAPGPDRRTKPPLARRARVFVRLHPIGVTFGIVILIGVVIGIIFLLSYFHSYESTDDAFIEGHLNPITPRIAGTVIAVHVENNQFVRAGQVLVDLDPRDFQVEVDQAQAALAQALAGVRAVNPNIPITQTTSQAAISTGQADLAAGQAAIAAAQQDYDARLAELRQAQAQNTKAQADLRRYQTLVGKDEISRQQYDTAVAAAQTQAASVQAAKASSQAAQKALDQRRAQLLQAETRLAEARSNAPRQVASSRADVGTRLAAAQAARARLEQAELNLGYTRIVAPVNGIVTNRSAEIGQHVQPGEALLSISQIEDLWITANFKETQLRRMRPGQSVDVHVDAFDQTFHGYVEWMPGASGEATSLLPPENATGNFVKVVQRLPVRIRLKPGEDPQHRLRIGMSVEPKVWL